MNHLSLIFISLIASSCSTTKTLKISTDGKAQISVLTWDKLDQDGKFLGRNTL